MGNIFTRLFKRDTSAQGAVSPATDDSAAITVIAGPGLGGEIVNVRNDVQSLAVSTAYRCIALISDMVSDLPLLPYKQKEGIFVPDHNSMLYNLLTIQPQREMSATMFWKMAVMEILIDGNAYIFPRWIGEELELVLLSRGSVTHDALNGRYIVTDIYNGICDTFREKDIIHLYQLTLDGFHGVSVIEFASRALSIAATGETETLQRFGNGGNVRGIVSNDNSVRGVGEYQDEQLAGTAKSLDGKFRSGNRIVSVPGQVQFTPLSLSSTDIQFLESRKYDDEAVCRFFGVPPSFVGIQSSNYKTAEMSNVEFLSHSLNPLLSKIENEVTRKLIAPSKWQTRKIEYDRREIYALDLDAKAKYQSNTIAAGIYTVNDWRKYENQPPVKGGDVVLVSTNLAPIDSEKLRGSSNESNQTSQEDEQEI